MCLLEIGLALRHLHTAKLAHCDLKPGNVLLRSSPRDPRGFVCKLADFG
jgi:serine/threonine protein kinase